MSMKFEAWIIAALRWGPAEPLCVVIGTRADAEAKAAATHTPDPTVEIVVRGPYEFSKGRRPIGECPHCRNERLLDEKGP